MDKKTKLNLSLKVELKNPIVWNVECFQMVGFFDPMSIIEDELVVDCLLLTLGL